MRLFVALDVPEPPRRDLRRRVDAVRDRLPRARAALQDEITRVAVATLGFTPEEREFQPHVTLARCPDPWRRDAIEKFKPAFTGPIGPPFVADRGILFESKLSPKGARYREVAAFAMEGDG
jgi:2'-5' RNA ligase